MTGGYLVLEDGTNYEGELFGINAKAVGELIFASVSDGYQETMTDPAYRGQMVVITYPLVGNYGTLPEFNQSKNVQAAGLIVNELCRDPSPQYGGKPLDEFMKEKKVAGISGIDTRALVIKLREGGTMKAAIVKAGTDLASVVDDLKAIDPIDEANLVAEVSSQDIKKVDGGKEITVGVIDCGCKKATVDRLSQDYNVIVFPYNAPADVIKNSGVKGIVVVGGPGNPVHPDIAATTMKAVKSLMGMPMLGLGSGYQIIAASLGAKPVKMKFGHHGSQPVRYDGRVYMTSQAHIYTMDEASLTDAGFTIEQLNMNDGTVEGVRHKQYPIIGVEYRPEGAPGATETDFVFEGFAKLIMEGFQ